MKIFKVLIIVAICIGISQNAFATRKIFTFSSNFTSATLAEGKELTILKGNATVIADDVQIEADEIKLYGDDFQYAEVSGSFIAIDLKNDFSLEGDALFYDRAEKLLRAKGNIVMKDNQNDVVIRAHFLESKNDGDFMVVQLGVRITKSDELSARTEFLTYYRKTEILEMTGFPYALWKEDEYRADRVSINLDTDEVLLEGKVQGFISTVQEEESNENRGEEVQQEINTQEINSENVEESEGGQDVGNGGKETSSPEENQQENKQDNGNEEPSSPEENQQENQQDKSNEEPSS